MDFFSIFQNNTTTNDIDKKKVVKKRNSKGDTFNESEKLRDTFNDTFNDGPKSQDDSIKKDIYNTTLYKNIKRGDFVKIIRVKDSNLNVYKGYIGEIKDYKRDQDFAIVFLHSINNSPFVKFPIDHFIITD
jgi:hypothetical protein